MHLFAQYYILFSFLKSAFSAFWSDKSYDESMRHRPVSVSTAGHWCNHAMLRISILEEEGSSDEQRSPFISIVVSARWRFHEPDQTLVILLVKDLGWTLTHY